MAKDGNAKVMGFRKIFKTVNFETKTLRLR